MTTTVWAPDGETVREMNKTRDYDLIVRVRRRDVTRSEPDPGTPRSRNRVYRAGLSATGDGYVSFSAIERKNNKTKKKY